MPIKQRCSRCGFPTVKNSYGCAKCLMQPLNWENLYCIANYQFPYDQILHRFKYQKQFWVADYLTTLLAKQIIQPAPILIPVPMHWRRQMLRGYNQSQILAAQLARKLNVHCNDSALVRQRATKQQQGLNRKERLSNLRDAFLLKQPLAAHIALVDDVVTTGATINEICKLLKNSGVDQIDVYCIARSIAKQN